MVCEDRARRRLLLWRCTRVSASWHLSLRSAAAARGGILPSPSSELSISLCLEIKLLELVSVRVAENPGRRWSLLVAIRSGSSGKCASLASLQCQANLLELTLAASDSLPRSRPAGVCVALAMTTASCG